jgi:hypothetical protein
MSNPSSNGSDTRKKPSPRDRAQAHLRRMMRAAGIAGAAVATTMPTACGPKSDDGGSSTQGDSATQSTTWDDPCFPDGCDPVPPTTTSDTGTTGIDTTVGSTTWDDPCFPDGCDPVPPTTTSDTTADESSTGQPDTDTDSGTGTGTGTGTGSSSSG